MQRTIFWFERNMANVSFLHFLIPQSRKSRKYHNRANVNYKKLSIQKLKVEKRRGKKEEGKEEAAALISHGLVEECGNAKLKKIT